MKLYELKKGDKLIVDENILEFEEIRGEKAIFYNEIGEEISFPDYLSVDEIGDFFENSGFIYDNRTSSLF